LDKLDAIRGQMAALDWSARVVEGATLAALDGEALAKARELFGQKYANRFSADEVAGWSDAVFLERARLTQGGRITRTALLLLGKAESAYMLSPHPAQLTWKLAGEERAYEHFGPPFLLSSTLLYQKIRNVQLRILPEDQLIPVEVAKYDRKIVLEALHNCVAHQDYMRNGRILVTERADRVVLESEGGFFDGRPDDYVAGNRTPRRYRNPFLAQAMSELSMIDTMGYGIHSMYVGQARRFFPLPDYDLSEPRVVKITLHGALVDLAYSRLLIQKTDLSLVDILALDRVQKKLPVDEASLRRLRLAGMVEGRKPNVHVSAAVANATERKAQYIRTRGQDDAFYIKLIGDYLAQFGSASRQEINDLLWEKLSEVLDSAQREYKIGNLLGRMRRSGLIQSQGARKSSRWSLNLENVEKSRSVRIKNLK
jgi:ATP-dependent DNA helicase RecG